MHGRLENEKRALLENHQVVHAFGDLTREVDVLPSPDELLSEQVEAGLALSDLRGGFPFLDGGFEFGIEFLEPLNDGGGGGGVFGFEGGLEVGQGLGHSAGFDLFHSDQELGPESLELFSHGSELLLEFGLKRVHFSVIWATKGAMMFLRMCPIFFMTLVTMALTLGSYSLMKALISFSAHSKFS